MAYHVHTTRALILKSRGEGEGHKILHLLTEDLGVLTAHAQSVRVLKSKLRYHLQDYTLSRISLVRGRSLWRVTGAETISRAHTRLPYSRAITARLCSLAFVLTLPDDPHTDLFQDLFALVEYLGAEDIVREELAPHAELLTLLRMLARAGFLEEHTSLSRFISSHSLSNALLDEFVPISPSGFSLAEETLTRAQVMDTAMLY